MLDFRTFGGVNMDLDHNLVAAKIRLRISNVKNVDLKREDCMSPSCYHNQQLKPTLLDFLSC